MRKTPSKIEERPVRNSYGPAGLRENPDSAAFGSGPERKTCWMICGKRGRSNAKNIAPQIEFFFAPANKRLALAPDLIGIYFGFFFFLGRRKSKSKLNKEQTTLRTVQALPLKKPDKDPN